jgi:hypothetical protein
VRRVRLCLVREINGRPTCPRVCRARGKLRTNGSAQVEVKLPDLQEELGNGDVRRLIRVESESIEFLKAYRRGVIQPREFGGQARVGGTWIRWRFNYAIGLRRGRARPGRTSSLRTQRLFDVRHHETRQEVTGKRS